MTKIFGLCCAIAESGSGIGRRMRSLSETENEGVKFAESKGANPHKLTGYGWSIHGGFR